MSSEIALDLSIVRFKIDLADFTSAVKTLANEAIASNEKEQARTAIKEMIVEVRKTFDTIVDTLTPLYGLMTMTESEFSARFAAGYQSFKMIYLKRSALARNHCHIVQGFLEELGKRRAWMANLPLANRAFTDLEQLGGKWLAIDDYVVAGLEDFFDTLNAFMDEIAGKKPTEGLKILTDGLKLIESKFKDISAQLGELDALGRRL
jgi:NCAIR mutase (PurE)-related protein